MFYVIINLEPPKIIHRPDSVIRINRGDSVSIKCTFRGRPEPTISWLYNGEEITVNGSPVTGKERKKKFHLTEIHYYPIYNQQFTSTRKVMLDLFFFETFFFSYLFIIHES